MSLFHQQLADLLLKAYFGNRGDDRMAEYVLRAAVPSGRMARDYEELVFLRPAALTRPALLLRSKGPRYLRALSLTAVKEKLREFIRTSYPHIVDEVSQVEPDTSFGDWVSPEAVARIAETLARSTIFNPTRFVYAFPLTPISVEYDFDCGDFYLIDVHSLTEGPASAFLEKHLSGEKVRSWFGVRAPVEELARKHRRIVLGAVALTMTKAERHQFTLGRMASSYLCFKGESIWSTYSLPHTPPLGSNIRIRREDHAWLGTLAGIIESSSAVDKRKRKALEYYYRAWFLDATERAPLLFMALDAVFGQGAKPTGVKIREGVGQCLGPVVDAERLEKLMQIRHAVLHGGAPDVFSSSKYAEYCEAYETDPIDDLEALVAKCLRKHLFGDVFRPQPDSYAELLERAREQGILPKKGINTNPIVQEWP